MDTQRLILLFIFGFSVLMLWEAWQKENRPRPAVEQQAPVAPGANPTGKPAGGAASPSSAVPAASAPAKGETVVVRTDLMLAEIDTLGATLKRVELLHHKDSADPEKSFVLLGPEHQYEAQSGLTGDGPNHRSQWTSEATRYELAPGAKEVRVKLTATAANGISVEKVYTFSRDSYVIGDTPRDIDCGAACHMKTIAVATGRYSLADLAACQPTFVCTNLTVFADALLAGEL